MSLVFSKELEIENFKERYGNNWTVEWDDKTSTPHRIYGYSLDLNEITPKIAGVEITQTAERDIETVIRDFISNNEEFFKVKVSDLKLKKSEYDTPFLPDHEDGTWYVFYEQNYDDLPVYGSYTGLIIINGRLVLIDSNLYPDISIPTTPKISEKDALESMKDILKINYEIETENISLVVFPKERESDYEYHLSWMIELPFIKDPLGKWVSFVDAQNGELLYYYNNIVNSTLSGYVSGKIYPEYPAKGEKIADFYNENVNVINFFPNHVFYSGSGNYLNNYMQTLSKIDLSGVSQASLTFSSKYFIEWGFDRAYVQVSTNNITWNTVANYTGWKFYWSTESVDLSSYVGQQIYLKFNYSTDPSVIYDGFYLDNISVITNTEIKFSDDAESGGGKWIFSGFGLIQDYALFGAITDENGYYEISGLSGNVDLYTGLEGPYVNVMNMNQSDAYHSYNTNTPASHSWNWVDYDYSYKNEESNVFYHVNEIHDYFTRGDPFDIYYMNYAMNAYVEYWPGNSCNAMADGSYIYFFGPGYCESAALGSGIIYHEYTHNVVAHVYTTSLPYVGQTGAMNEAWADYFGASIFNNPVIGEGIFPSPIRYLNNSLKYPDDWYGEVHYDSQILSGAMWDLRNAIGTSPADSLIMRVMKMEPHSFSEFLDNLLIVDDDNSNILDGTPHSNEICNAFRTKHGIFSIFCTISEDVGNRIEILEQENVEFRNRIGELENKTSKLESLYNSLNTTTTTVQNSSLETRVSALETLVGKFIQAICSIKYSNYFGFCPLQCPRPYSCSNACVDDMIPPYCYDRTIHSEYFCSYNTVCCESVRITCPK